MTRHQQIEEQLKKLGLRPASNNERGRFVTVLVSDEALTVWTTKQSPEGSGK